VPAGLRHPAALGAGVGGRLGRVRLPRELRRHHAGGLRHRHRACHCWRLLPVMPPVRIESSASSVTEGQTLDLNCVVAGQGQATVTWYKRGGSLPPKHQVEGDVTG
ncbi:PGBM protein, partial [Nothoprocta ornata]|nr:PGBM protein [Nothoprocta pentlandii]NWY00412.1 PGBM protein [Nothoprocta ornata]